MEAQSTNFLDHFMSISDHRVERTKLHGLSEIIFLTLCGILSGCEGWIDIEDFGKSHLNFLRKYLPFKNGIPSDDTLRRFFRALDTQQLSKCFQSWIKSIANLDHLKDSVISIDGKTSCGSNDTAQSALHMVSAYATELRLVLCQQKVSEKSNEIRAIPELLDMLDLRGAIVTIDAMGTQKNIASKIRVKEGHYLLALKKNQGNLHEEVQTFYLLEKQNNFKDVQVDIFTTFEKGHGRIEKRTCYIAPAKNYVSTKEEWADLENIISIESEREIKGVTTKETRYYITSLEMTAEKALAVIRSHWAIENSLHWVLDMSFGEDQSKIRKENAPANMAVIRHMALNFLNNAKPAFGNRISIKRLRRMAGWEEGVLQMILSANF